MHFSVKTSFLFPLSVPEKASPWNHISDVMLGPRAGPAQPIVLKGSLKGE